MKLKVCKIIVSAIRSGKNIRCRLGLKVGRVEEECVSISMLIATELVHEESETEEFNGHAIPRENGLII